MSKNHKGSCTESLVKAQSYYLNQATTLVWKTTSLCARCAVSAVFLTPCFCSTAKLVREMRREDRKGKGLAVGLAWGRQLWAAQLQVAQKDPHHLPSFLLSPPPHGHMHVHVHTTHTYTWACTHRAQHTHGKLDRCSFRFNTEVGSGEVMVRVRVQNWPHYGLGTLSPFPCSHRGEGDSGRHEIFLLLFKNNNNNSHKLLWPPQTHHHLESWETQFWEAKGLFPQGCLWCSSFGVHLISPNTKCDFPTPLPSYISSYSEMALQILE